MPCLALSRITRLSLATVLGVFAVTLVASAVRAETLVSWDFSSLNYTGLADNSEIPNPVLPASAANGAAGITVSDLTSSGLLSSVGNLIAGEGNFKNWDTGGDGTNDNFLEFSIDAPRGIVVDALNITVWRNGAGAPNGYAFDVNVDNTGYVPLGANIQVDNNAGDKIFDTFTFDGTTIASGATNLGIRFTPRNAGAGSTGNLHIAGLQVLGTAVVPEPASWVLLATGLLPLARRCRKQVA